MRAFPDALCNIPEGNAALAVLPSRSKELLKVLSAL
jgi:hypothetical protein